MEHQQQTVQNAQHPQHPQNPQGPKRARKRLRDTCNSCAHSKVKCSRDQPSCERCIDRGLYCTYSPSRRTGKRMSSNAISLPSASMGQYPLPAGLITPTEEPFPSDIDFLEYDESAGSNGNSQFLMDANDSMKNTTLGDNVSNPWGDPLFAALLDDITSDTRPEGHSSRFPASQNILHNIENSSHPDNGYMEHTSKSSMGSANSCDGTGFSGGYETDTQRKEQRADASRFEDYFKSRFDILASGLNSVGNSKSSKGKEIHQQCPSTSIRQSDPAGVPRDCMTIALDALQSLHRPQPTCTIASEGSSSRAQILEIDDVLAKNKEIMDAVALTLKCSCSLDTQLALILTCIGFKIIAWYSAVARSEEDQEEPTAASDGSAVSKPVAERVNSLPITVGKYHFDGDDRVRMRAQMALGELNRVVKLIEQLGSTFNEVGTVNKTNGLDVLNENSDEDMAVEKPETEVVSTFMGPMLVSFLRDRVRAATNATIGILKESQQAL